MMNKKTRHIIGYLLMIIGILLPLYAFSHLSLDKIQDQKAYEAYHRKLEEGIKKNELDKRSKLIALYISKRQGEDNTYIDPFAGRDFSIKYDEWEAQGIFAYLRIPVLNFAKPIRLDASEKNLSLGVAHVYGTDLPIGGKGTRSVIAGHRGWYTDEMFLNLAKLSSEDKVYIELPDKVMVYQVKNLEVIRANEPEKLTEDSNKDLLTLLTCDPITPLATNNRLLVNCEREGTLSMAEYLTQYGKKVDHKSNAQKSALKTEAKPIKSISHIRYFIYGITLFLWFAFFSVVICFIRYLKK